MITASREPIEEWRLIAEFPSYEVSNLGRVRRGQYILRGTWSGYLRVTLYEQGRRCTAQVHVLVAKTFLGPKPSDKHLVAHIDGDSENNKVDNLRWATAAENSQDGHRLGEIPKGEDRYNARLTAQQVLDIRSTAPYRGYRQDLSKKYKIDPTYVDYIRQRRVWRHI